MRTALVTLLILATALAGCSGGDGKDGGDGPVTCPDGRVVEPAEGHGHGDGNGTEGEDTEPVDPCFVAPSVQVTGLAATLGAYATDTFQWTVHNGSVASGHSMLGSLRYSTEPADPATLAGADSWGTELVKKEHNNLPATFDGTIRFDVPGVYYVRVYAQVRGEGFSDHDYWSGEFQLNVTPVQATGRTVTVTHGPGNFLGELDQVELDLALGDGLILSNQDVTAHTFTFGPGCPRSEDLSVEDGAESEPLLFTEPGQCQVSTDDVQPQTLTVHVAAPA